MKREARVAAGYCLAGLAFVAACLATVVEFAARKLGGWSERLRAD